VLPVARVAVSVPLAHLDRPFDYLVPEGADVDARPGVRVRVRFAGRLVDGFLLERVAASEHGSRLGVIERVISPVPVLSPEIAALARTVADRYAGTLADVLRLAVPPRHARAEEGAAEVPVAGQATSGPEEDESRSEGWAAYPAGPAFLAALASGRAARAVWQALPGEDWPARLAEAAAAAQAAGRGSLLVVPDARDLDRLDAALTARLGPGRHVLLAADLGPAERYRRFLAVRRDLVRVVAGTRGAVFAPVENLGLLALWDDGDDLLAEPRAPYPHAREVLVLRSAAAGIPLLVGGYARTAEAQLLVASGWARAVVGERAEVRRRAPRIEAAGDDHAPGADSAAARARLSPAAFAAARWALDAGAPVLVQVPRRGYLPGLACADCRRPARCRRCRGPLGWSTRSRSPSCRWCGSVEAHVVCPACGSDRLRATVTGASRTAEEIGRAFPGVKLVTSSGNDVRATVRDEPAIVVATPGAEPLAARGYGVGLLLDGSALLGRPDLRAAEETLRRWMAAAALVRPVGPGGRTGSGGRVIVNADAALPTVQALIRWDPVWHAEAELAARTELGFPPAMAMASLDGADDAVGAALAELELPPSGEVLGPVPVDGGPGGAEGGPGSGLGPPAAPEVRALVRTIPAERRALAAALRVLAAGRSARKAGGGLRIVVDPVELG
jgi:primosomal protein N' (replication factor Y)